MDWHIVEQHGLWWAYKGELPPPEAFQNHGRPRTSQIVGPCPSRVIAERCCRGIWVAADRAGRSRADVCSRTILNSRGAQSA